MVWLIVLSKCPHTTYLSQCLDTLVQFGEFLSIHTSPDEYKGRLPSLTELRLDYHLPVDVAFYMLRPVLHTAITVSGHCANIYLHASTVGGVW